MTYDLCGITSGTPGSVTVTVPAVKVRFFERNGPGVVDQDLPARPSRPRHHPAAARHLRAVVRPARCPRRRRTQRRFATSLPCRPPGMRATDHHEPGSPTSPPTDTPTSPTTTPTTGPMSPTTKTWSTTGGPTSPTSPRPPHRISPTLDALDDDALGRPRRPLPRPPPGPPRRADRRPRRRRLHRLMRLPGHAVLIAGRDPDTLLDFLTPSPGAPAATPLASLPTTGRPPVPRLGHRPGVRGGHRGPAPGRPRGSTAVTTCRGRGGSADSGRRPPTSSSPTAMTTTRSSDYFARPVTVSVESNKNNIFKLVAII